MAGSALRKAGFPRAPGQHQRHALLQVPTLETRASSRPIQSPTPTPGGGRAGQGLHDPRSRARQGVGCWTGQWRPAGPTRCVPLAAANAGNCFRVAACTRGPRPQPAHARSSRGTTAPTGEGARSHSRSAEKEKGRWLPGLRAALQQSVFPASLSRCSLALLPPSPPSARDPRDSSVQSWPWFQTQLGPEWRPFSVRVELPGSPLGQGHSACHR